MRKFLSENSSQKIPSVCLSKKCCGWMGLCKAPSPPRKSTKMPICTSRKKGRRNEEPKESRSILDLYMGYDL